MDKMVKNPFGNFFSNKKIYITGHTGFKGSWLCMVLHLLGSDIYGYSLDPPTEPSLFRLAGIDQLVTTKIGDIRDFENLKNNLSEIQPEIVIHLAAQPLVRESYSKPIETYQINVMGTINILEAMRYVKGIKAFINVTTDKCYENREWLWGYRENEPMGGFDPYSNSKACSELITAAFRDSFFNPSAYEKHGIAIASARAGNVIGGGDWAADRLIPDIMNAFINNKTIKIRNPNAIRPWQHVLEPLTGYLMLVQKLYLQGIHFAGPWNFGPKDGEVKNVQTIVEMISRKWEHPSNIEIDTADHPHEANYLKLDCSKANTLLNWQPRWNLERTMDAIVEWYKFYIQKEDMRQTCFNQIDAYFRTNNE